MSVPEPVILYCLVAGSYSAAPLIGGAPTSSELVNCRKARRQTGGAPDRSEGQNLHTLPAEMAAPFARSRIEDSGRLVRLRSALLSGYRFVTSH